MLYFDIKMRTPVFFTYKTEIKLDSNKKSRVMFMAGHVSFKTNVSVSSLIKLEFRMSALTCPNFMDEKIKQI